jgi:hypothetical protein
LGTNARQGFISTLPAWLLMIGTHLTISSRVTIIFGIASQRAARKVQVKLKARSKGPGTPRLERGPR